MFCDIHNHVLFGVDDGSKDLEESLQMLDQAVNAGIDTICATSHVHAYETEVERLEQLRLVFERLESEVLKHQIPISLHLGCEIYYTSDFSEVAMNSLFRYNQNSRTLLVELPPTEAPPWFADLCFNLKLNGIRVILAHPERNAALLRQPKVLLNYINSGIFTQVTAGSCIGKYGPEIEKFALKIVQAGACSLVATDAHNTRRRPFSDAAPAHLVIQKMVGTEIANQLFDTNPRAFLNDEDVVAPDLSTLSEDILLKSERKKFFFF